jgi:hypothetical protein
MGNAVALIQAIGSRFDIARMGDCAVGVKASEGETCAHFSGTPLRRESFGSTWSDDPIAAPFLVCAAIGAGSSRSAGPFRN